MNKTLHSYSKNDIGQLILRHYILGSDESNDGHAVSLLLLDITKH